MDNLTHTALGLFLGRAGLNRWTPRATAVLVPAMNAYANIAHLFDVRASE